MLDLLRFGVPMGAAPVLQWLRDKARERLVLYLRAAGRGETAAEVIPPTAGEATVWLEGMPPLAGQAMSTGLLTRWFSSLAPALERAAVKECCTPVEWLCKLGEGWQQLGRLCFHLAENAGEDALNHPFAFLATFVHKVGPDDKPRHAPLGLAARLLANDHAALGDLLRPLRKLAEEDVFWARVINSGDVYKPCAWGPRQAYALLEGMPRLEEIGIEVRMVNLWKTRPPKAELTVTMNPDEAGGKPGGTPSININSLVRFIPQIALGDRYLTDEEVAELLSGEDGLVRFRGEWVRLDRERLGKLLDTWKRATRMAAGGIPLLTGLRYLLGKRSDALPQLPPPEDGIRLQLGERLTLALSNLHFGNLRPQLPDALHHTLRHYQEEGVRFLLNVTESGFGACLADDMGLGKTLQVISWLVHLHKVGELAHGAALVVAPASLITNWQEELSRFAPQLRTLILHPYALSRTELDTLHRAPERMLARAHVALTTYGMVTRLERLPNCSLPALVLDEAQAIKNAASQRSQAVLRLQSSAHRRVALTGTPVENSLTELHSLFSFLTPGLLGSEREFAAMVREMGSDYTPLRRLVRPFMLRRLKSDPTLLPELPPKTEQAAYCLLTSEQTRLYAREVEALRAVLAEPDPQTRLTLVLPILGKLKQICNHPAQYLGESYYDPALSGKMQRLGHLAGSIAAAGDCCLVFTQYRSIIEPLHDYLEGIFGSPGLCLHGGTGLEERRAMVEAFRDPRGPRFFILSLRAGGTGLTLTRARHVIHFDRWWNPAVENQASDRAYRIGQKNPVVVHPLICRGTIEENIHRMIARKQSMADALLSGGLKKLLLNLSSEELLEMVGRAF